MASVMTGHSKAIRELAAALHLPMDRMRGFSLEVKAGEMVTVKAEYLLTDDCGHEVVNILKKYKLEEQE